MSINGRREQFWYHAGDLVEVNSGGQVLFCFFAPAASVPAGEQRGSQSVDLDRVREGSACAPPAGARLLRHPASTMSPHPVLTAAVLAAEIPAACACTVALSNRSWVCEPDDTQECLLCNLQGTEHAQHTKVTAKPLQRWPHTTTQPTGQPWRRSSPLQM